MNINLQAKNVVLNDSIRDYVLKKVTNLGRLLEKMEERGGEVNINFEIGRNTNHHRAGEVFYANCSINIDGEKYYLSSDANDINGAVDDVKENLFREISKNKNRKRVLFHRGARKIKNMMKGITSYNPWKK